MGQGGNMMGQGGNMMSQRSNIMEQRDGQGGNRGQRDDMMGQRDGMMGQGGNMGQRDTMMGPGGNMGQRDAMMGQEGIGSLIEQSGNTNTGQQQWNRTGQRGQGYGVEEEETSMFQRRNDLDQKPRMGQERGGMVGRGEDRHGDKFGDF